VCTLVALHRCVPGAPLLVAANRDEHYARPSEGPRLRSGPHGLVLAPLDRRAGGTWLGIAAGGLVAAVTNRPCPHPDPERRSRGLLVLEALGAPSAAEAARALARLPRRAYNPFNLFVADRHSAHVVTYEEAPRRIDLGPGPHVIGNADPEAVPTPKLRRLRREARRAAARGERALEALESICRRHDGGGDPLAATCVHTPGFGTRSSALLRISDFVADDVFRFAEDAPCKSAYEDLTPLLHALGGGIPRAEGDHAMRSAR